MNRYSSKSLLTLAGATVALAGCASITAPFRDADPRWADYKSWRTVSDEPSTGPSLGLGAVHKGPDGYRMVYVNDVAHDTITGEGPYEYPEGTVIVKEQYEDRAAWESGEGAEVTVSLKVADVPEAGGDNWQWAAGYKSDAGDSQFCSSCHSIPFAKDYVFSNVTYLAEQEAR